MKVFIFTLISLMTLSIGLYSQSDDSYIMYSTITLTPLPGHSGDLAKGLKDHNTKYHKEAPRRVSTWQINSGPKGGSFFWVMGPVTWSDMDDEGDQEHLQDWLDNVDKHVRPGSWNYWRLNSDLSYAPENFQPSVQIVRYFKINDNKYDAAMHTFSSLINTYKEMGTDMGVHVFRNAMPGIGEPDIAITWQHSNWASMDTDRKLWDAYEKKYDMDSHDFFDSWRIFTEFLGAEIHVLMPELSSPSNE